MFRLLSTGPECHLDVGQLQDHPVLGSQTVERLHLHCGVLLVSENLRSPFHAAALESRCVLLGAASSCQSGFDRKC